MTKTRFALFADCLLLGVFTAVASIPVITVYPAFVAACSLLREEDISIGGYLARLRQVLQSGLSGLLVPPLAMAVLAVDALAVAAGVPGSTGLAGLLVALGLTGGVLALRIAALWRPTAAWPQLARAAARDLVADLPGSSLLACAFVATVGIALLVPLTLLLLGGMLALAAVAAPARKEAT